MNIETFFLPHDIEEIYNTTIIYSILKYQNLPPVFQETFKERYKKALEFITTRNINLTNLQYLNIETVKQRLIEYEIIYKSNIELNKQTIKQISHDITRQIIYTINEETNEINKISYLFDFITNYLTYSEDYNKYCLQIPPIDNFTFEFKNNTPIEPSINGTLVMGQGICEDISNLLQFLGRLLNLNIETINCTYKKELHSLNMITLSDGNKYLIDATRLIRKDKNKEECFLVSSEDINKNNFYQFKDNLPQTATYTQQIPNYKLEATNLIEQINQLRPQVENLNTNKKTSLR